MKSLLPSLLLASFILLSVPTLQAQIKEEVQQSSTASQSDPEKEALQRRYTRFLGNNGYSYEIDSDGDVRFDYDGSTYFIGVNTDPEFFTIVLANIWTIESETERRQVYEAADYSTGKTKVAKVYTVKDNVWIAAELLIGDPDAWEPVFERSMSVIVRAKDNFVEKMNELRN